jgi:hypothetical protein
MRQKAHCLTRGLKCSFVAVSNGAQVVSVFDKEGHPNHCIRQEVCHSLDEYSIEYTHGSEEVVVSMGVCR